VGYYDKEGESLRYAGKVGTGFDQETLNRLVRLLKRRERKTSPFKDSDGVVPSKGVHWVTPNLVGQFGFAEWTDAGKLRHPRFMGLRRDKDPEEVVREDVGWYAKGVQ
jgi:ATP-dependent DNA ligase